jgi:hypothetical protein
MQSHIEIRLVRFSLPVLNGAANQISNCQSNIAYSDLLSDNTLYRFNSLCKIIDKKTTMHGSKHFWNLEHRNFT